MMENENIVEAINNCFMKCRTEEDFEIAKFCVASFLWILPISVEEKIECLSDAGGSDVQTDDALDELICNLKEVTHFSTYTRE